MFIDSLATFATAQSSTISVASTDIIDTLAAGDAYGSNWFVVRIDTTYVNRFGLPTISFQLQTSDTSDFSSTGNATLVASAAFLAATLVAGRFWATRVPMGVKRYLRAYQSVTNYSAGSVEISAGKFDAFLTEDINNELNHRRQLPL